MSSKIYETTGPDERSIFQSSSEGFSDAASDARAAAKVAAQNVKDGVGLGVYKAAFGISFGVVFTGVFLTELLPAHNVLRRGLEDGADAALDAIEARKVSFGTEPDYERDIAEPAFAAKDTKPSRGRKPSIAEPKPATRRTRVAR